MQAYFYGKKILITGASSGIGENLALSLAPLKTYLALLGRNDEKLKDLQEKCKALGAQASIYAVDVADRKSMQEMASDLLQKWGGVDIVIANAGLGGLNPGDQFDLDIHDQFVAVNFQGTVNTLMPFIPSMIEKRAGQLIAISSMACFRGLPAAASYSSTKAAQRIFMESLRVDLRKHGIAVGSIHPGFVESAMTRHNEFQMPFKVSVKKSSQHIIKAIAGKKAIYLYPFPMKLLTFLNIHMPTWLYDRILPFLSGQKASKAQIFKG